MCHPTLLSPQCNSVHIHRCSSFFLVQIVLDVSKLSLTVLFIFVKLFKMTSVGGPLVVLLRKISFSPVFCHRAVARRKGILTRVGHYGGLTNGLLCVTKLLWIDKTDPPLHTLVSPLFDGVGGALFALHFPLTSQARLEVSSLGPYQGWLLTKGFKCGFGHLRKKEIPPQRR